MSIEIIREKPFNLGFLLGKLSGLDVVNMDICKLFNNLKYFKIDFAQNASKEEVGFIEEMTHNAFNPELATTIHSIKMQKSEINIDCDHSKSYAIMHINTQDQKGLLAHIIDMFDEMGIDIVTAKVHTLKNRVRDMFLIEKNRNFCHNVDTIIEKLTGAN